MNYNSKHYAYIGDCVWELFIRKLAVEKTSSQAKMHEFSTQYVCANYQAEIINEIKDILEPDELQIQKLARNLKMTINKKNNPKIHSLATSFEAVIGYIYFKDKTRLNEILEHIKDIMKL